MAIFFSSGVLPLYEVLVQLIHELLNRAMVVSLRMCHPSHLGCETFDVVLFPFENILGHKHGKRAIPHANAFDILVEPFLDLLPDEV